MNKQICILALACLAFCACSKGGDSDPKLETPTLSVAVYGSGQIVVKPNLDGFVFEDYDERVVSVSSGGLVTGKLAGTTPISVIKRSGSSPLKFTCNVTVSAATQMYREPYFGFGGTVAQVKGNETRVLGLEDTDVLIYVGEHAKVDAVAYYFENSQYDLSVVYIPVLRENASQLEKFLRERYIVGTSDSGDVLFFNVDQTVAGMMEQTTVSGYPYYAVLYFEFPVSAKSTSTTDWDAISRLGEEYAAKLSDRVSF